MVLLTLHYDCCNYAHRLYLLFLLLNFPLSPPLQTLIDNIVTSNATLLLHCCRATTPPVPSALAFPHPLFFLLSFFSPCSFFFLLFIHLHLIYKKISSNLIKNCRSFYQWKNLLIIRIRVKYVFGPLILSEFWN